MTVNQLRQARQKILILMLFYKNDENDYKIYINSIKNINEKLEAKSKYKKSLTQLDYLIKKVVQKNTPENRERLKNALQIELLAKAKA